ncbi:hypothetical protein ACFPRL_04445 [Pseudoclavibacter helvolus]
MVAHALYPRKWSTIRGASTEEDTWESPTTRWKSAHADGAHSPRCTESSRWNSNARCSASTSCPSSSSQCSTP